MSKMAKVELRCGGVTLAVEVEHLRRRVTLPGNGVRGHRGLDAGQVLGGETDTQRAEAFRKPFACAGADQRDDVGARASTQAMASCAGVTARSAAARASASARVRFCTSRLSDWGTRFSDIWLELGHVELCPV